MKLQFLGAAQIVTGSSFLIEVAGKKILIDCGMFQGSKSVRALNYQDFLYEPVSIDCVILTHAHIDHCGLLPKLCKQGFKGSIYATKVTSELCHIMLPDSAHIQESDAEIANRKGARAGKKYVEPIYTIDDAFAALQHFVPIAYNKDLQITPEVMVRFSDAGHIIGSAIVEVFVTENDTTTKLLFSGDLGQPNQPIIKDPAIIHGADYVITESTYGNRVHLHYDKEDKLAEIIQDTAMRGGNVIIPSFAVGRTQALLFYLHKLWRAEKIPAIPVIIDSPLAIAATQIFAQNTQEYDEESTKLLTHNGKLPEMPQLALVKTAEESKALNSMEGSKIIISASGMADAGRILHHLKHNLWRAESSVVFVGYQAEGSMGRRLVEGIKRVKIMGEEVRVKAEIYNLDGFSAHADRDQIMEWLGHVKEPKPANIFLVHGEPVASQPLAAFIQQKLEIPTYIPRYGDIAIIEGRNWHIEKADIVIEPVVKDLEEILSLAETEYLQVKKQMINVVLREPNKLSDIKIKIDKVLKYMKKIMNNI
ncbi:MBL fold metallo-hydrolase RNA specificity domain-containing protein [Anaerosinus massiliensis]|uniref:MBL fold metallo-hydrolase RNA specificity domain-containing protein n=1 Tax=Massilibacillus massiliensis TaxID=1806837 RepID=UPI000B093B67|nr:MBL fold metallo-hydrolase [Massilibacillus massiliensis]